MKINLKEKVNELVERGHDLDEIFYEMRDDEEIKFEKNEQLKVEKSAIAKNLKFRFMVGL